MRFSGIGGQTGLNSRYAAREEGRTQGVPQNFSELGE